MDDSKPICIDAPKSVADKVGERVDINLGHACNYKCIFCMQGNSTKEQRKWVDKKTLFLEMEHYSRELGVKSLGLLGGEPTLYPWLSEALDYARQLGFDDITINTNGFMFADAEFTKNAVEHGLNRFCISIHSESPKVEDFLSGQAGALKRKLTAIRNIVTMRKAGHKITLSINAVLNNRNYPTMDRYVAFYKQLGITDIRFNFIRPEGRSLDHLDIVPSFSETMPKIMETVLANENRHKIFLSFGEIPYCVYPSEFFSNKTLRKKYIGEYRDRRTHVSTFGNQPGNLSDDNGKQRFVWQDLRMNELKTYVDECRSCPWVEVCGGVWTHYLEIYGDSEFKSLEVE